MRVFGYRLRAILRRQWSDYVVLALLVTLIGGVAMGSVVVGRRTQSAFASFLSRDNASTLTMSTYGVTARSVANHYSPALEAAIRRLPEVQKVEAWVGNFAVPIQPDGTPNPGTGTAVNVAGSLDGAYFDIDRVTVVKGRLPDPAAPDEFMTSVIGAQQLGLRVGQKVPIGVYDATQLNLPGFGTPAVQPFRRVTMTLTAIVEFNNQVIQDDTDRLPTNVVYTPAFTRTLDLGNGSWFAVRLKPEVKNLGAVEEKLVGLLPPGAAANFSFASSTESRVESALRPESIALGVFGLIAALAALGICLPMITRLIQNGDDDRLILRALGAGTRVLLIDSLAGLIAALAAGTVGAVVASFFLSTLAPVGPVRQVYHPTTGALDWVVTGAGVALFLGALGTGAVVLTGRAVRRSASTSAPTRVSASSAGTGWLPPAVLVGLRFAVPAGRDRSADPTRAMIAGAMVSVGLVVATLTFASGLRTLVAHPALYGWDWDYALTTNSDIPPAARSALDHDPQVLAWTGYDAANIRIDGLTVPSLNQEYGGPTVTPIALSGRSVHGRDEIVLGQATLRALGKHVGDEVEVSYGSPATAPLYLPAVPMRIVGTATLPAIAGSNSFAEHTSMGVGALLDYSGLPESFLSQTQSANPIENGPPLAFVRFRPGVTARAAQADLERIIAISAKQFATDPAAVLDSVSFIHVLRPASIVNYRSTGATPLILASGLAIGAVAALAMSLLASVRRRRRDLAVLRTLGFVRNQVVVAVLVHALVIALLAVAVGIPVGIAAGRQLWIAFARSIYAVPRPTVPWSVAITGAATVLIALAVAVVPGWLASRTPAATVLRAE